MPRLPSNPTNGDLANAIYRLDLRADSQDEALEHLQAEITPLKESMSEVLGVVKFIRATMAIIGAVGTVVAIWTAVHGH